MTMQLFGIITLSALAVAATLLLPYPSSYFGLFTCLGLGATAYIRRHTLL
jgi:hypothetical protein